MEKAQFDPRSSSTKQSEGTKMHINPIGKVDYSLLKNFIGKESGKSKENFLFW